VQVPKKKATGGKRGNNEGTIRQRPDGRWEARYTVGVLANGKPDRRSVYGKTRKEVADKLSTLQRDLQLGLTTNAAGLALADHFKNWIKAGIVRKIWRANTLASYENAVGNHLTPVLGKKKLGTLTPSDVQKAIQAMLEAGKSDATVAYSLKVLRFALKYAVRLELVPRNVAESVDPPRRAKKTTASWNSEEVAQFLEFAQIHKEYALWYVALATGLRRGELLGLQWKDIDFVSGRMLIRRQLIQTKAGLEFADLKTETSDATQRLSVSTLTVFSNHLERQNRTRAKAGKSWNDFDLCFPLDDGRPRNPRGTTTMFRRLVKASGLKQITLHGSRHSAGSQVYRETGDMKLTQEFLRHKDSRVTSDTYTHLDQSQRDKASLDLGKLPRLN
jgi:integrase